MFQLDAIMTANVITVRPSDTLERAHDLMKEHRIRHLPVINDAGELVGILTQTDLLAATDSILRDTEDRLQTMKFPVESAMMTDVSTVPESASLRQAALYLEKNRIGCLPVTSEGRLTGIITDTDFVGIAINLLEQIEVEEPIEEDYGDLD